MGELGWDTEALTLGRGLIKGEGQPELLAPADRADLIILAFPLYIDSLPMLMSKALEAMTGHRRE